MKRVIVVGPSLQALDGFDLNKCSEFDIVVGTNKVMESELSKNVDFDVIFLNSTCAKHYSNEDNFKKLKGKTIFTKQKIEANWLKKVSDHDRIYSMDSKWNELRTEFSPHVPYYGTAIVSYLKDICQDLYVVGFDFYLNGFSAKKNYIKGYYDLEDKEKEESCHSLEKDLKYYAEKILNSDNVLLDASVAEYYKKSLKKYGLKDVAEK